MVFYRKNMVFLYFLKSNLKNPLKEKNLFIIINNKLFYLKMPKVS